LFFVFFFPALGLNSEATPQATPPVLLGDIFFRDRVW
jgi:hypothetical protein